MPPGWGIERGSHRFRPKAVRRGLFQRAAGLLLIVPVFVTGFDWTRWLIIVSFDVAIVFTVFAARRPEIDRPPTSNQLRLFLFLVLVLALIPIGTVPGFGGPRMI